MTALPRRRLLAFAGAGLATAAAQQATRTARAQSAAAAPQSGLRLLDITQPPFNAVPNARSAEEVKRTQQAIADAAEEAAGHQAGDRMAAVYIPGLYQKTGKEGWNDQYNAFVCEQLSFPDHVRLVGDGMASRLKQADGVNDTFLTFGKPGAHLAWFDVMDLVIDGNWAKNRLKGDTALVKTNGLVQRLVNVVMVDAGGVMLEMDYDGGDGGRTVTPGALTSVLSGVILKNALRQCLVFKGPSDAMISDSEFANASQEGYAESDMQPDSAFYPGAYSAVKAHSGFKMTNSHIHMTAYLRHPDGVIRFARRPKYSLEVHDGALLNVANSHIEGAMTQFYAAYSAPGSMFTATRFYSTAGGPAILLESGLHSFAACHIGPPLPNGDLGDGHRAPGATFPQEIVGIQLGTREHPVEAIEFDGQVHHCRAGAADLTWSGRDCWIDIATFDCGPGYVGTPARESEVVGWPATPVRGLKATGSTRADALGDLPPNRALYVIEGGEPNAGILLPERHGAHLMPRIKNATDSAKNIYHSADSAGALSARGDKPILTLMPQDTAMAWSVVRDGKVYWDAVAV